MAAGTKARHHEQQQVCALLGQLRTMLMIWPKMVAWQNSTDRRQATCQPWVLQKLAPKRQIG